VTAENSQLAEMLRLRHEIEEIDKATREPATATMEPDDGWSYSFGTFSGVSPFSGVEQTVADIAAAIRTTLRKLAPVATLETSREGMIARTVINYSGRATSVWSNTPTTELAAALEGPHLESIRNAYALRAALMGAIAAAGSSLVSISAAVLNPLTALHALASARALKQALERLAAAVERAG
jgi:hypothetical protein